MIKKNTSNTIKDLTDTFVAVWRIGNNKINSISKIKKINAIKKNCSENGVRPLNFGINPHSKGLFLALESGFLILNTIPTLLISSAIIKQLKAVKKILTINKYRIIIPNFFWGKSFYYS